MRTVAILTLMIALLAPAAADAQVTRKKAIWGPIELNGRSQFPLYEQLGVGIFQMSVSWREIARSRPSDPTNPNDPAYVWPAAVDRALELARPHGIQLSLLVMHTPGWANGGRDQRWAPDDPDDYADFVAAASRRWPAVRHWMIWGEPTKASNWQPLVPDRGRPLRGAARRPARLYAQLLDRSYVALKRVNPRNLVIGGNTYTVGDVAPLHWLRAMRLPNGRPPRMDLYGHNAFSARRPDISDGLLASGGVADFGDLDVLWRAADRYLRPRSGRMRIFISEFTLPTGHRNHEFNFWVSERTQASWIASALRETRRQPRIYTFGYLGLYDDPVRPDGLQVERGLLRRDGRRKPAFAAFARG